MARATKEIDLLLVNPSDRKLYQGLETSIAGIEPPFWAGLIASFIRSHGYEVAILDADVENLSAGETADRVAQHSPLLTAVIAQGSAPATSSTPKMAPTGDFLRTLKTIAPNLKTILGGIHPSSLPERTLREESVDYVYQGEGFHTILELLKFLESTTIADPLIDGLWYIRNRHTVSRLRPKLLPEEDLPAVAWDLLDMTKYRAHNWHCLDNLESRSPYGLIYTSLGCPYNCHFCNIHQMYLGTKPSIRYRKPEGVVEEIDLLVNRYGIRNIKVMDELFTLKRDYVMHLCDLIIGRSYDLNIWAYGRVGLIDYEMLKKMKRAGINWVCYGFESASKSVRRGVGKKFGQGPMTRTMLMTRDIGINIQANFIFGLPDDSYKTMAETLSLAEAYNFEWVNFYSNCAYPGSKLYDHAIKNGATLPEPWADYGQYSEGFLPLPTKHLSSDEVLRFRDNAFKKYFTNPRYLGMIERKFGEKAVLHIKGMLEHEIRRKWLS